MSYVKGGGNPSDVRFKTLSCKDKVIIGSDCRLNMKSAFIRNLEVANETVRKNLDINGNAKIHGNLSLDGCLNGNTCVNGNINVNGNIFINGEKIVNTGSGSPGEFTRLKMVDFNMMEGNVIVTPTPELDPTSIQIVQMPCSGVITNFNPLTGNVTYTPTVFVGDNIILDIYQYSGVDNAGTHLVTQFVCSKNVFHPPFLNTTCYPGGFPTGFSADMGAGVVTIPINAISGTNAIDWSTLEFLSLDDYTQNMESPDNMGWFCGGSAFNPTLVPWGTSDATGPFWTEPVGVVTDPLPATSIISINLPSIFVSGIEYGPVTVYFSNNNNGTLDVYAISVPNSNVNLGNTAFRLTIRVKDTSGNSSNIAYVYFVVAYV